MHENMQRKAIAKASQATAGINLLLIAVVAAVSLLLINGPWALAPPAAFAAWCAYVQLYTRTPPTARERWARSRERRNLAIAAMAAIFMVWQVAYPLLLKLR